ncbi:M16 family metallopeptidase [Thalassotalea castellviae]|uniref:Pitrilysin family protein n=1 Tax=Thalassotalea castellviae TaxID=3075612 RepID=A0ABU2ZZW1_9GAMM|nr:pitrilysin family protein [Thalassotalea sp. W431]MDT0603240.1 pitrilysin family protein [Thalassotalea sp. W431]
MEHKKALFYGGLFSLLLAGCSQSEQVKESESAAPSQQTLLEKIADKSNESPTVTSFNVPIEYFTLDNGLKVVLSPDDTAPTVTVAVYYNIGFRNEPRDSTGFAHLFEHMMFQGSENLGKMEFIKLVNANGGVLNGSTRFDYTNYFEIVPSHKLETFLWAEADRMKGLAITQENLTNQQGVVKNEVKVNVLNQPYGGFPWLDMPQYAYSNWFNAHNFYGDLEDLDAASLKDVDDFFNLYYAPNNAALVVVGDINIVEAKAMVEKYFAKLPASELPPAPDLTELRQEKELKFNKFDKLAPKPAYAFAYKMPERNTPEYYAMGIIDQILVQGEDSLLYQELVKNKQITGQIGGGINYLLGNMFNYNGPMLWMSSFTHDENVSQAQISAAIDSVITRLEEQPLTEEEMSRAIVKIRSSLFDSLDQFYGFGKADLLASFALFDNDPAKINALETSFKEVTPELIMSTAKEYLRNTNRTILTVTPGEDPDKKASNTDSVSQTSEGE